MKFVLCTISDTIENLPLIIDRIVDIVIDITKEN